MKSDPQLASIPVLAPSLIGKNLDVTGPMLAAACPIGSLADLGNVHSYPGGQPPELLMQQKLGFEKAFVSGSKPVITTESGYNNATGASLARFPSPEWVAGTYLPRIFLEDLQLGIKRTYIYELVDEGTNLKDPEHMYGLLRNDLSLKPAAVALQNLTSILADSAPITTAADPLAYSITDSVARLPDIPVIVGGVAVSPGPDRGLRHVLLRKSDGSLYLAIWRYQSIWDNSTGTAVSAPDYPVTLSFATPKDVAVYRPSQSGSPVSTAAAQTSVTLPVGPGVNLVRLT